MEGLGAGSAGYQNVADGVESSEERCEIGFVEIVALEAVPTVSIGIDAAKKKHELAYTQRLMVLRCFGGCEQRQWKFGHVHEQGRMQGTTV